jgi:hypothetical protein
MHIAAFQSLIDETRQWMEEKEGERIRVRAASDKLFENRFSKERMKDPDFSSSVIEMLDVIDEMQSIRNADNKLPDDHYVNDLKYKAVVTRMLSSQAWSKQKLWLWLENEDTDLETLSEMSLKDAHRKWLAFLKQRQHAVADVGSDKRRVAAIKILQCKGFIANGDVLEEENEGEPLIYAAAADSWAIEDLQA